MCVKRAENLLSGRGQKSVEEGTKILWIGGTCLDWGGVPLDGYGPPIHTPHPPDIGQPWSNSLLDI